MGWCHKRLDRLDLAIEDLENAMAVDPGEAMIPYNLACYWSLYGDKEQALQFLTQALEMDPDYRELTNGEPDFDPIREDAEFQLLTSTVV